MLQDRLDPVIGRLRARHHHRQRAVHRALDAAADRRIDQRDVARFESCGDQFGRAGSRGGEVDHDRGAIAGYDSIRTQGDGFHDIGHRQAGQHDVRGRCDFGRRFRQPRAPRHQRLGRLGLGIVDAQRVAGVEQAAGHRSTHTADADKADCFSRHDSLPCRAARACSCRAGVPGRVSSNFKIVSQSVKQKISIDSRCRAGIGSRKQGSRNSLRAAG